MGKSTIKQISHPDNDQLSAKYIGSKEYLTPKTGRDGKVITGVDENAYSVMTSGEPEEIKKNQAAIKKLREYLEKHLNIDLTPSSDFWDKFYIVLEEERFLDPTNPLDQLHERFLVANRYVAPSFEAIESDPDYYTCLFYIFRDEEESKKKATGQKKLDGAKAELFSISKTPDRLREISAHIFGYEAQDISPDDAYIKLNDFLEVEDKKTQNENIARFLDTVGKTSEEIQVKKILDKALKLRFVTSKANVYRRGEVIYGNNYEEALEYLLSPENSAEIISLEKQTKKG